MKTYRVQAGDSLESIGRRHGISKAALWEHQFSPKVGRPPTVLVGLAQRGPDILFEGQTVYIPECSLRLRHRRRWLVGPRREFDLGCPECSYRVFAARSSPCWHYCLGSRALQKHCWESCTACAGADVQPCQHNSSCVKIPGRCCCAACTPDQPCYAYRDCYSREDDTHGW